VAREIEVTRRLYRSGESEYLIDGQVCRLRDVHDLLMDTGLGAKAYAIIEQGKIGLILSSRPTDRRQLIEEAAGITKYKARRRAAELKLEAAHQNLTRIDDIVFEVEKQRGTLKRQAAKARRYQKLRDELRRWEKVLFARKYRQLAETIESTRARSATRASASRWRRAVSPRSSRIWGAFASSWPRRKRAPPNPARRRTRRSSASTAASSRLRSTASRCRRFRRGRPRYRPSSACSKRVASRPACCSRNGEPAAIDAVSEREQAAAALAAESGAYDTAHREIEGLEADVEAARSEVFSAINSATALRHALEHAAAARDRVGETLSKLDVEAGDIRIESDRAAADRAAAVESLRRAHEAIEAVRIARAARESELASARIEHEWRARAVVLASTIWRGSRRA
jgi:chromosome segregation protein